MAKQISTIEKGGTGAVAPRPAYAMTSAEYVARAVTIAVYPIMEAGQLCLSAANEEAEAAIERFKASLAPSAPAGVPDASAWAAAKVRDLFAAVNNFTGDVWYSTLPNQDPLLVVKQASLETRNLSLDWAVRRTHLTQVAAAVRDGLPVPDAVMEEYRLSIDAMTAREVQ